MTPAPVDEAPWLAKARGRLRDAGLDVMHAFAVDQSIDALFPFPRFERNTCLGLLIGNSKALWEPFVAWVRGHSDLEHPLQRYVETVIPTTLRAAGAPNFEVFFSHRLDYAGHARTQAVPMQRLAGASGAAALGPAHLSVHPEHGPWFAIRALVVLDAPASERPNVELREPCESCPAPCKQALQRALAPAGAGSVAKNWQVWLAVREVCPARPEARYSDAQIRYHYQKDPAALKGG